MLEMPPPGSVAVSYSRYSSDLQSFSSIEGQERANADFAARHGLVLVGQYRDAARSGTTTVGRRGLHQMLADAEEGKFKVVIIEDLDRLSRDAADMHQLVKDLGEPGVVVCTVASNGPVSDIEMAFKAVQSQQFIKQNVLKSKRGMEQAVASGRACGSIAYGYEKVQALDGKGEPINGLREIDPGEASILTRISLGFDAGKTTFKICRALNAEGVPGSKGKKWRPGSLLGNRQGGLGLLRNPLYIGEYHFLKTKSVAKKGKRQMTFRPESERTIELHPEWAILPRDLWDRVQARLASNYDRSFHSKKKNTFIFTGRVHCGECGGTCLVCDGRYLCTGRRDLGTCSNSRRVKRGVMEATVLDEFKLYLLSSELVRPCVAAYRDEVARAQIERSHKLESLKARSLELTGRVRRLMDLLASAATPSGFGAQALMAELDKLEAERVRVDNELATSGPDRSTTPIDEDAIVGAIRTSIEELERVLESDDREASRAREIIRGLVTKVTLTPHGPLADGRGGGDVRITVEGPLGALMDLADPGASHATKAEHGPMLSLGDATLQFAFSYVLEWRDPRLGQVYADVAVVSQVLDGAAAPVPAQALLAAISAVQPLNADEGPDSRLTNAIGHLKSRELIRNVYLARARRGYVWSHISLTVGEWRERAIAASPPPPPPREPRSPEPALAAIGPSWKVRALALLWAEPRSRFDNAGARSHQRSLGGGTPLQVQHVDAERVEAELWRRLGRKLALQASATVDAR